MGNSNRALHCPECGYAVTEYEHRMTTYDYPCPQCQKATLSEFITKAEANQLWAEVANRHPEWFDEEEL